ncbi:MAG: UDP-N-acetylmuramoyl-tripeptide--D-alanyl-D-alanine ligase [Patescibacteria group bacterium]
MRFLRRILVTLLGWLARATLLRYRPTVVAVTGSVGKTTTKELTAAMLASRYRIRKTEGNYNTEIGVPLTVLGQRLPRSVVGWPVVFAKGLAGLAGLQDYPEVLVLELAADKPGDMRHLAGLVNPDVAVVTNVRNVHRESYDSIEQIAEEKAWLVRRLKTSGVAVLNHDDPRVRAMRSLTPAKVRFYGESEQAHYQLTEMEHERTGYRVALSISGAEAVRFRAAVHGRPLLAGMAAAIAAADALDIPLAESAKVVSSWTPPPGRLRVFNGTDGRTILDDSYNASPEAVIASLETLQHFPPPRRAVLGDMKELGDASVAGHRKVGAAAATLVDELVVVGESALLIAEAAREAGLAQSSIHIAGNADEAARLVGRGGSVLVKGSRAMRLERTVAALLKDPRDRRHLIEHGGTRG